MSGDDDAALEALQGFGAELEPIEWSELAKHNTKDDMWCVTHRCIAMSLLRELRLSPIRVCIDNVVYDMTNFIAIVQGEVDKDTGMPVARHPGGMDIPMQFAGKDASMYWNDIHGHVKFDILEDVAGGEAYNTGLDVLPIIMGRTEGPTPPELEGGLPVQGKDVYDEIVEDSLEAMGQDAEAIIKELFAGLDADSQEARALGAILGCFAGDAAAQPAHWNYAQSVYQNQIKTLGMWEEPEFMRPSLNAFYRIPNGASTCYCDQGYCIMESIAATGKVDPEDIERRFEEYFKEGGSGNYGSLRRGQYD